MTLNTAAAAVAAAGLPGGQGWRQAGELGLPLGLSACMGVEREIRQKHVGLRTHTLVGLGASLFTLISKYGFNDVVVKGLIIADPSRMAAQIVPGVGFLGAGLIFVPRGRGVLRQLLQTVTAQGFTIGAVSARSLAVPAPAATGLPDASPMVEVSLHVHGRYPVTELAAALSEIDDVDAILIGTASAPGD
jgi:putative Mg2+ transporter-C (MgtC) family protein